MIRPVLERIRIMSETVILRPTRSDNLANFSNLLAFDMIQRGELPGRLGLLV